MIWRADVPYLFDSLFRGASRTSRTATQDALAQRLIGYWTSFAASGVPGGDWAPATGNRVLQLDGTGAHPIDIGVGHHCDLWDRMRPR